MQVKLFLGAIGGELSAELPFVLMHPKPNMKKILKADTLAEVEGFQVTFISYHFAQIFSCGTTGAAMQRMAIRPPPPPCPTTTR